MNDVICNCYIYNNKNTSYATDGEGKKNGDGVICNWYIYNNKKASYAIDGEGKNNGGYDPTRGERKGP